MAEISAILKDIWTVLLYFLPGYAFFGIFRYCRGEKPTTTTNTIMVDVIVSVICVWIIKLIFRTTDNFTLLVASLSALIILAIFLSKFVDSVLFDKMFSRFFHLTTKLDFWRDVVDCDGTVIYIIRKDRRIVGCIHKVDTEGDNRWMQLSMYKIFDDTGNLITEGNKNQEIAIKISDDDLLCFGYHTGSTFLQESESSEVENQVEG
jgi:hypothetical protein